MMILLLPRLTKGLATMHLAGMFTIHAMLDKGLIDVGYPVRTELAS